MIGVNTYRDIVVIIVMLSVKATPISAIYVVEVDYLLPVRLLLSVPLFTA